MKIWLASIIISQIWLSQVLIIENKQLAWAYWGIALAFMVFGAGLMIIEDINEGKK